MIFWGKSDIPKTHIYNQFLLSTIVLTEKTVLNERYGNRILSNLECTIQLVFFTKHTWIQNSLTTTFGKTMASVKYVPAKNPNIIGYFT